MVIPQSIRVSCADEDTSAGDTATLGLAERLHTNQFQEVSSTEKANKMEPVPARPISTENRPSSKRENYLEWQEYFMSIAFLSAQRSKDPRTQVGACIVNPDNKVVGIGYNGMPIGCNDDMMPWNRAADDTKETWLNSKSPYVCHAELNAVLNKNLADIRGCSIYVALFPCNMCSQIIIQSGIKEVVYYSDKYHDKPEFQASRYLLNTAGVKYRQFRPRQKKIVIDFDLIEGIPAENPTLPKQPSYSNNIGNTSTDTSENNNSLCKDNTRTTTTNNNNVCLKRKTMSLENHAEQQNLQQINELQFSAPAVPTTIAPQVVNAATVELKFAIVSWILMFSFAVFVWYLSSKDLIFDISA